MKNKFWCFLVLLGLLAISSACNGEVPESGVEQISTKASELQATVKMSEETAVAQRKTVFFDLDGGPVTVSELWNPFIPGRRLVHGFHQALMEPLFILNYETGEIEPWLGESMSANESFDV